MRGTKQSSPIIQTPTKSNSTVSSQISPTSTVRLICSSKRVCNSKKSLQKSPDSIQSKKTSTEETQSSPNVSSLAIRLKLEPKSSPRRSLKSRPDSIKPFVLKYDEEASKGNSSRVNSPTCQKFFLTLNEDAIQRPYLNQQFSKISYKESSYSERMEYWRKKKVEQYKIAKNIESFRNSDVVSPKRQSVKDPGNEGKCENVKRILERLRARGDKNGVECFHKTSNEENEIMILNRIPGSFSYSNTPKSMKHKVLIKMLK
jgi:hypothetical protein